MTTKLHKLVDEIIDKHIAKGDWEDYDIHKAMKESAAELAVAFVKRCQRLIADTDDFPTTRGEYNTASREMQDFMKEMGIKRKL